jgi:hypothetical protein
MIGLINIVKYAIDSDVSDGFDIEQLILSKREDNLQFNNQGDPITKFVYFNTESKEYSMIYMYDNESKMISQHTDYLTEHPDHTTFPDPFNISRYGPLADFDVKIRPITIADDLIREMRASLELGYKKFADEDAFNALDVSDKTKFDAWAVSEDVDDIWTTYPDETITNDKDFEYLMYETRGMSLNFEPSIFSGWGVGVNYYEDDLKAAITASKTATFSDAFFTAITDLGVTVDNTQF